MDTLTVDGILNGELNSQVKSEMEQETEISSLTPKLKIALDIQNISAEEFCEKTNVELRKFDENQNDIVLDENKKLLFFKQDNGISKTVLFNSDILFPFINEYDSIKISMLNDKGKEIKNGLIIKYFKEPYGLLAYIPFDRGRKLYGHYTTAQYKDHVVEQYFSILSCKNTDIIHPVPIPNYPTRSVEECLLENDKICISNESPHFMKLAAEWNTVGDALVYLNSAMSKTVDRNYIEKIMYLSNQVSYPSF